MFINLIPFAENSQKIPPAFLAPDGKVQDSVPLHKIFTALFIDMSFISLFLTYMGTMLIMTINAQFLPPKLMMKSIPELLQFSVFPILGLAYFFGSNLLNNGQSIGMNLLKIRLPTCSQNFYESFTWAAHSVVAIITCGLSLTLKSSKWKQVKPHDFLYSEFLAHKDHADINLLERIELFEQELHTEEDFFQIAA